MTVLDVCKGNMALNRTSDNCQEDLGNILLMIGELEKWLLHTDLFMGSMYGMFWLHIWLPFTHIPITIMLIP